MSDIIEGIANRIISEHRKHSNNDDLSWAHIAAKKIYESYRVTEINQQVYSKLDSLKKRRFVLDITTVDRSQPG